MSKTLVIVESPAKAKTIAKFLGRGYFVRASMGHVRDLPKSKFGVDVADGFKPEYITIRGKGDIVKELKDAAKQAGRILLATDPDREGEAIAWHLGRLLDVDTAQPLRIEFHEITKRAVSGAVDKPRAVNMDVVGAQQTRRILDRIVGYQLSPLLWQKVRRGLSAGRVQSVAVRLICDREKEIQEFKSEEYWTLDATLASGESQRTFLARLAQVNGKKAEIRSQSEAEILERDARAGEFRVAEVRRKEKLRFPAPPFTTSSLQQEASRKLGYTARKTMQIAQQLYEGLEVPGEGAVGLISYIRTDAVRVAEEAQTEARDYIGNAYGTSYLPPKPPVYKGRAGAQEAHEAVRPTSVHRTPESLKAALKRDQLRLYQLIWNRFVASQMAPAVMDTVSADLVNDRLMFRATGSVVKFPGFIKIYTEGDDTQAGEGGRGVEGGTEAQGLLPELREGQLAQLVELHKDQHFTEPPPRFSEAMLVKTMEELGIGRPSTYAPTIETIQDRGYVGLEQKRFHPTDLGMIVVDLLKEHFPDIIGIEFTAALEEKLDEVEDGRVDGTAVLGEFYGEFAARLAAAKETLGHVELPVEETDEVCELCGRKMVIKTGRFGKFLACPGFPECRNAKPIRKETGVACPDCGGAIVERRSRKGRVFYGCVNYPKCTFTLWDEPTGEKCPACGRLMVNKRRAGEVHQVCSDPYCGKPESERPAPGADKVKPGRPGGRARESGTGTGARRGAAKTSASAKTAAGAKAKAKKTTKSVRKPVAKPATKTGTKSTTKATARSRSTGKSSSSAPRKGGAADAASGGRRRPSGE